MKTNNLNFILAIIVLIFISSCGLPGDPDDQEDNSDVSNAIEINDKNLSGEHEWTNHADGIDYFLEGEVYFFDGFLTIEEGTTIAFGSDASLKINHNSYLDAEGSASKPILFTGENKTPGFYKGLVILSNDVRNSLAHCIFEYGGSSGYSISLDHYDNTTIAINNCTIRNGSAVGIKMNTRSNFTSCSGNKFNNIASYPIECSIKAASNISSDNQYENNGFDGPSIVESRVSSSNTSLLTLKKQNYHIQDNIDIDAGLAISPGSTLTFAPEASITVDNDGYFIADGTASQRITFTGEINSQPSWNGICFEYETNDLRNSMKYCDVLYAGFASASFWNNTKAGISITQNSRAEISNCHIANSGGCGIVVDGGGLQTSIMTGGNNTFFNNNGADICE